MDTNWQKSSLCSGGDCIYVRRAGGRIEINESRRPAEVAWSNPAGFALFLLAAKAGEFDHLIADSDGSAE